MRKSVLFVLISLFVISTNFVGAQTPTPSPAPALSGIKATLAAGEVAAINQADNKISLKTSDGNIDVILTATTPFKKVSPEKPDLKTATDTSLAEIGVGDKILVTGNVAADKKTIPAKVIYLMTKSDISKRNAAERELWRTHGISGRVELVDFKTKTITIVTRSLMGETKIALTPKDEVNYKRYAPDSVKFSDAQDSNLAEIKVGDQLRALGDKGADGLTFKAEQIVTGAFKTVAGKVTAIDVAKNEITIEDAQTKKPVTIVVNGNSLLKKMPAQMQAMMGGGQGTTFTMGGGGQGNVMVRPPQSSGDAKTPAPNGQGAATNVKPADGNGQTMTRTVMMGPDGKPIAGGNGQPQGFQRGGRGDLDEMFNNFPALSIADLKVGDTIGVTSTAGNVANRYTAIKLLSGVEGFLNAPRGPMGGGGQGSQSPSFNIPGLDGGFGN
jgi:hypothetical protein